MKKIILSLLLSVISICLLGNFAVAAVVGSTDDPILVGGGARPLGMGRAFDAIADDADAIFLNPGGLAGIKGLQAMSMFTNLFGDVYYDEYAVAIPTPWGTTGIGYITTGVNDIPTSTTESGLKADYYDSLLDLSYSVPIGKYFNYGNNIFAGLSYKIYSRGFSGSISEYATGTSADLGIKYIFDPYTSIGVVRQNFLPVSFGGHLDLSSGAEESIDGFTKIGIAHKPAIFNRDVTIGLDADLPSFSGRPVTLHFGTEWKIHELISLRCGLDQSIDADNPEKTNTDPTYGISFGNFGFRVDYAYHPYYNDPSLATTYLSISYKTDPWFALKGTVE